MCRRDKTVLVFTGKTDPIIFRPEMNKKDLFVSVLYLQKFTFNFITPNRIISVLYKKEVFQNLA